jgi:hypothetical protein
MKRGFAFQQAQIFFYVLEVKRLLAFLFSVLFVDSLIAIHPQKAMQTHFWKINCLQSNCCPFSGVPHNYSYLSVDSLAFDAAESAA